MTESCARQRWSSPSPSGFADSPLARYSGARGRGGAVDEVCPSPQPFPQGGEGANISPLAPVLRGRGVGGQGFPEQTQRFSCPARKEKKPCRLTNINVTPASTISTS